MRKPDILGWFGKPKLDDDLLALERRLQANLEPVTPRAEFISDLRFNLMHQNLKREPVPQKNQPWQDVFLVVSGIVGIGLALLTGVRGLVSLISVVGLLVSWFRQTQQKALVDSKLV